MGVISELLERRAQKYTGYSPQTPEYWLSKIYGATEETAAAIDIDEAVALTYSAVWAAVNIIAGAVGYLPLVLYRREDENRHRADKEPLHKLLHDRPNPYMDALTWRECLQGHVCIWGNGYSEIERNGAGQPIALWPIPPNQVEARVEELPGLNQLYYQVTLSDQSIVKLPYMNVLHIKGLGFDGLKGYSVITQAREAIGLGLATEKFGARFFGHGARASAVLEHPGRLGPDAQQRLRSSIENQVGGLDKAHRLLILEEGMQWKATGIPPEDAQFLETRNHQIVEIARWFQVPPHMLAELGRATWGNIEHMGIEFVTFTLVRWLRRWEHECTYKLLPPSMQEYYYEFLVSSLLRGDQRGRYDSYQIGIQNGWLSPNDVRRLENMNPIEGGDEYGRKTPPSPFGGERMRQDLKDVAASFEGVLAEAIERMARKETNDAKRAARKGEADWPTAYYERFATQLADAVRVPLESAAIVICKTEDTNDAYWRLEDLKQFIQELVETYVQESRADVETKGLDAAAQAWEGRAKPFAQAQLQRLVKLLEVNNALPK